MKACVFLALHDTWLDTTVLAIMCWSHPRRQEHRHLVQWASLLEPENDHGFAHVPHNLANLLSHYVYRHATTVVNGGDAACHHSCHISVKQSLTLLCSRITAASKGRVCLLLRQLFFLMPGVHFWRYIIIILRTSLFKMVSLYIKSCLLMYCGEIKLVYLENHPEHCSHHWMQDCNISRITSCFLLIM